jgi:signal transduction histidine kinase/CheY-like chemotaxis protein
VQGPSLEVEWRRGALRASYFALAVALVPISLAALSLDVRLGVLLLATLPLNLLGSRLIDTASPGRLRALACALLVTLYLLTQAATLVRGPTPLSAVALTVFVVTSGVLLGRRALWVAAVLVGLGLLLMGAAFFSGLVPQPDSLRVLDWGAQATWVRIAAGNAALIAVLCAPVLHLLRQFERGARELDRTLALQEEARQAFERAAQARSRSEAEFARAQRAQVVGTLGAAVAHGFNNALVVVRGGAELLCSEEATPKERSEAAAEIRDACSRAAGLTRKLLSLARPEGARGGAREAADVQACFDELARTLGQVLPADVHLVLQPGPGLRVRLEAVHLEQVLLNLALNARDAMPAGGTLTLSAAQKSGPPDGSASDGWVRLRVQDTGAGLSPEAQARLFEPFFSTKPAGVGAGLGLSTSQKIVEAAGGRLSVESAPGAGTTAEVLLPAAGSEHAAGTGPREASSARGARVLLVEPDASVRRVSTLALTARGFSVLEQAEVLRALEAMRRQREGLDLLCLGVPLSAPGAAALVEEFCGMHASAKVLVCAPASGDAQPSSQVSFLPKPFSAAELARRATELLGASGGAQ